MAKSFFSAAVFLDLAASRNLQPRQAAHLRSCRDFCHKKTQKRRSPHPLETATDHPFLNAFRPKIDHLDCCHIVCVGLVGASADLGASLKALRAAFGNDR